jgi:LacI family transcriptional regulator
VNDGKGGRSAARPELSSPRVTLRELAEHLELSPATVSLVINHSPVAKSIPAATQKRIFAAAKRLHYRANFFARSLRRQRSFTIGVVVPEVSDGYAALVMSGIEDHLLQAGYFYFVASHRHRRDLIDEYPQLFLARSVEGLIAVDTRLQRRPPIPAVAVSGHQEVEGVTNIVLNHRRAAALALEHLVQLGHRRIAFIKGQSFSSDTDVRWKAICDVAQHQNLAIETGLVVQLVGDSPSPELGYVATKQLLHRGKRLTALFAFNDISAIGAMRALGEAGLRVPLDVSVLGFDDIQSAAFQNPGLTTIRQPLRQMGVVAAETVLRRIADSHRDRHPKRIVVEPELVVRASTGPVSTQT